MDLDLKILPWSLMLIFYLATSVSCLIIEQKTRYFIRSHKVTSLANISNCNLDEKVTKLLSPFEKLRPCKISIIIDIASQIIKATVVSY